jgi:hypothetical protein
MVYIGRYIVVEHTSVPCDRSFTVQLAYFLSMFLSSSISLYLIGSLFFQGVSLILAKAS